MKRYDGGRGIVSHKGTEAQSKCKAQSAKYNQSPQRKQGENAECIP